jgi:hypothetical protein
MAEPTVPFFSPMGTLWLSVSKRPALSCSLTLHLPATSTPMVFHCRRRRPLQHQLQL